MNNIGNGDLLAQRSVGADADLEAMQAEFLNVRNSTFPFDFIFTSAQFGLNVTLLSY